MCCLSFAQFERELSSERVRDKIAASRRKGKWTGGTVPLGYDAKDKKLVINKAEAETVRTIFRRYLELKSFSKLVAELDRRGIVTKRRDTKVTKYNGGIPFTYNAVAFSAADTFRLGGTNNAAFDVSQIGAQYLGFGVFEKAGSSIWTLTGTNATAKLWTVSAGMLNVDGTMANAAMTVNTGGTLVGNGDRRRNDHRSPRRHLCAGQRHAGLVDDDHRQSRVQSGALYLVRSIPRRRRLPTSRAPRHWAARPSSAVFASGSYISKQYTILTRWQRQRHVRFGGQHQPAGELPTTLSYDAKDAYLNLTLNFTPPSARTSAAASTSTSRTSPTR